MIFHPLQCAVSPEPVFSHHNSVLRSTMSKFVRSNIRSVFNLTDSSLNFSLTTASQQMKVNFSQHKSNACEQVVPFIWPFIIFVITNVGFLSAWTLHGPHSETSQHACTVYLYSHLDSSCNSTFSCIYQLSQCSLRKSFLLFKMHGPI